MCIRDRDVTASLFSILWNEMGFTDVQDSAERYSFWPACMFYFYVPDLLKKFILTDAQREERGFPTGLRRCTARTKNSAQEKATAAAAAGQGAQDSVRRRAAAETSDDSDLAPTLKVPRG